MGALSLTQAQTQLNLYIAAEKKVLRGQSYTLGTKTVTRADLGEIRKGISYYNRMVTKLTNGGAMRVRRILPRD